MSLALVSAGRNSCKRTEGNLPTEFRETNAYGEPSRGNHIRWGFGGSELPFKLTCAGSVTG